MLFTFSVYIYVRQTMVDYCEISIMPKFHTLEDDKKLSYPYLGFGLIIEPP